MGDVRAILGDPARERELTLREPEPGDHGWILERHAAVYGAERGWGHKFEAYCGQVIVDFIARDDHERERCWIAELDGVRCGSIYCTQAHREGRPGPAAPRRAVGPRRRAPAPPWPPPASTSPARPATSQIMLFTNSRSPAPAASTSRSASSSAPSSRRTSSTTTRWARSSGWTSSPAALVAHGQRLQLVEEDRDGGCRLAGELHVGEALQRLLEQDLQLEAGECGPEAEVAAAGAEGLVVGIAEDVEAVGVLVLGSRRGCSRRTT